MATEKVAAFFDAFDAPNWDLIRELLRENPSFAQLTEDEVEGWAGIHKLAYMAMDAVTAAERQAILDLVTLFRTQELEIEPRPNVSVVNLQTPRLQGEEKYGYSPAHIAADRRDQDMLRVLLTQPNLEELSESYSDDGNFNFEMSHLWLRTYNGQTVMHFIVKNGLHQIFTDFLPRFLETAPPVEEGQKYEPTINTKDDEGRTLLMHAAYAGQLEIFNALLLQKELDCRLVDNYGHF
jgi:ankyrin repeat protein